MGKKKTPHSGWERGVLSFGFQLKPLSRAVGRSLSGAKKYGGNKKGRGGAERLRFRFDNQLPVALHEIVLTDCESRNWDPVGDLHMLHCEDRASTNDLVAKFSRSMCAIRRTGLGR